jgi:hypothetical protein
MGELRNAYNILIENLNSICHLERYRNRRQDGMKVAVEEIAWQDGDWICLAQDGETVGIS